MLVKTKPMTNYENMNKLLNFLNVKNFSKTNLSNVVDWEIASCMQDVVINKIKSLVQGVSSIFLSYDEITISDQSWFSMHVTWLKIGTKFFYYYPCNEVLLGPLLIIWSAFWWMSWCFLVVWFWKQLHPNWSNLKLMWLNF